MYWAQYLLFAIGIIIMLVACVPEYDEPRYRWKAPLRIFGAVCMAPGFLTLWRLALLGGV